MKEGALQSQGPAPMFVSASKKFSRILQAVSSLALSIMMLVVVADVALRFFFNTPVRGAYDVVSVCLLIMVFFGIGPVIMQGKEIVIDLFDDVLPVSVLRGFRMNAALGTLAVFIFLGWSMFGPAKDAWRYGDRSLELNLPVWVFWAVAYLGLLGMAWAAIMAILIFRISEHNQNEDRNSGGLS